MIQLNKFYVSDSICFMQENIPDNFINLTITSPPYDDLRKYKGFVFDYKSMLNELYRVTKVGGVVVWVVGDKTEKGSETLTSFQHALYAKEIGFNIHDTMIYQKKNPTPMRSNRYQPCFEYMFVFSKGKPETFNPIMREVVYIENRKDKQYNKNQDGKQIRHEYKSIKNITPINNIFTYSVGLNNSTNDKIAFKHPAVFPDKLAEDHILSWSNEGDIVLDPMCGSGTTCKMAYLNNRNFIGVDMSEEYINDICIHRLEQCGWKDSDEV